MKGKSGKIEKIVFFFLRADVSNMATVKVNGKAVNKGKEKGRKFLAQLDSLKLCKC